MLYVAFGIYFVVVLKAVKRRDSKLAVITARAQQNMVQYFI